MSSHHHAPARPADRTDRAELLLTWLARMENDAIAVMVELRGLGQHGLADSLGAELGHVQQIRVAAANRLRIGRP